MGNDRAVFVTRQAEGAVRETIGSRTGDAKLRAEGRAGEAQSAVGGIKDAVRDATAPDKP